MASAQDLINSGLVDTIKRQYKGTNYNIPDKYFILIADYIDALNQLEYEGGLYLNPTDIVKRLPTVLKEVVEANLNGIHGITEGDKITMNGFLNYETKKLYFFHELTHAIQTRIINGHEQCSFYNGKDGMFLVEGATQYTAEILYHVSNGTNIQYRNQYGVVRGQSDHVVYSPLSEYQMNGNILMLMSYSMGIPLNQVLALGFRSDGRDLLKQMYEAFPGNENKFDQFMYDLEKIYSIDKLILTGYKDRLSGPPVNMQMKDGRVFAGNLQMQNELIVKAERELASNFIANYEPDYILANYQKVYSCLTNDSLKNDFLNAINQIKNMQSDVSFGY